MVGPLRIGILGIGDVLKSDDGFGPHVLRVLESHCDFPPQVVLRDLAEPGPELVSFLARCDAAILVHAVNAPRKPGDILVCRKHDVFGAPGSLRILPHDPALLDALLAAELKGQCPRGLLLVGVVPESTRAGYGLTESVKSAVAGVVSTIQAELFRRGVHVGARAEAEAPSNQQEEPVSSECFLQET